MIRLNLILTFSLIYLVSCNIFNENKIVVQAIEHFPRGLDPAQHFGVDETQIYSQIYETLLSIDEDYQTVTPNLAERWETSTDNQIYTFYLRPNVLFHDGSVLTSQAIKRSIEWQVENNSSSPLFNVIDTVCIVDKLTISFKLKYPCSSFLYTLASPISIVIISPKALQQFGSDIAFHPVGTGPFYLTKWKDKDEIQLTAFEDYRQGKKGIDQIIFRYYADRFQREESIHKDNVDILFMVSGFSIDRLKWLGTIDYFVQPPVSLFFIGFNNNTAPFKDIRVRKAVLKAINLPELVLNVNRGNAVVAKGPLPDIFFDYKNIRQEEYNIQEAKRLLKEAGYGGGMQLNFYFPKAGFLRQTIVELIKTNLAKIGITLNVKISDSWDAHNTNIKSDSSQIFIYGGKSEIIGDAQNFLYSLYYSESEYNYLQYKNIHVDKWLNEARIESDRQKRDKLYKQIVKAILNDTPAVFLYHVKPHFAFNREKIKSIAVNPYGIIQFNRIILNN
jgi:peptide/nickel transport system substrate-binding protein